MTLKRIAINRHADRAVTEKHPTEDGCGYSWVNAGREIGEVDLWIDIDQIVARLGRRALANKKGVARYLWGCIEVRVMSRRREMVP